MAIGQSIECVVITDETALKMKSITTILFFLLCMSPSLKADNPSVKLDTEKGVIVIELYPDKAPVTVDNFIRHVKSYHYDGLIFHRVIKGFMIQAGGFTFDMTFRESEFDTILNESFNGLSNLRGSIAMARTDDPDSALAQFFINHKHNPRLNARGSKPGYTVFGQVTEGMDVVDAIAEVKTKRFDIFRNVPVEPIRILSARLINPDSWKPIPLPTEPTQKADPAFERPVPINTRN